MPTFKTENEPSPISEQAIEKLVGVMMDIVNKKKRKQVTRERRCSDYFYNKAKKTLVDLSMFHLERTGELTKFDCPI